MTELLVWQVASYLAIGACFFVVGYLLGEMQPVRPASPDYHDGWHWED